MKTSLLFLTLFAAVFVPFIAQADEGDEALPSAYGSQQQGDTAQAPAAEGASVGDGAQVEAKGEKAPSWFSMRGDKAKNGFLGFRYQHGANQEKDENSDTQGIAGVEFGMHGLDKDSYYRTSVHVEDKNKVSGRAEVLRLGGRFACNREEYTGADGKKKFDHLCLAADFSGDLGGGIGQKTYFTSGRVNGTALVRTKLDDKGDWEIGGGGGMVIGGLYGNSMNFRPKGSDDASEGSGAFGYGGQGVVYLDGKLIDAMVSAEYIHDISEGKMKGAVLGNAQLRIKPTKWFSLYGGVKIVDSIMKKEVTAMDTNGNQIVTNDGTDHKVNTEIGGGAVLTW